MHLQFQLKILKLVFLYIYHTLIILALQFHPFHQQAVYFLIDKSLSLHRSKGSLSLHSDIPSLLSTKLLLYSGYT